MDYVIDEKTAGIELAAMEEEFGQLEKAQRPIVLDAIRRGKITLDVAAATVTYELQRPVDLENGKELTRLEFHEPNAGEIQRINRGFSISADASGKASIDTGDVDAQLARLLSVICGQPSGVINRIKRRDWAVLHGLSAFFG